MKHGMKYIFQKWLFLVVVSASFVTIGIFWWTQTSAAKYSAEKLLRMRLEDAKEQVEHNQENLARVITMASNTALAKARIFSYIVSSDPSILKDHEKLEQVRKELAVDEVHVSNSRGILIASIPETAEGYDMGSNPQSAAFLPAIRNKKFELVQELQPNGSANRPVQYAGVARQDAPGIVQIGYNAKTIGEDLKLADIEYLASTVRIGKDGYLLIAERTGSEKITDKIYIEEVCGVKNLCLSETCDNFTLTGYLPKSEIYTSRNSIFSTLIAAIIILFVVVFFQISGLLQNVVIDGISKVNKSLDIITRGDLTEKIDVGTSSEFIDLSNGINATVEALEKSIENEARRLDTELEMGRTIQTSVLPHDVPDDSRFRLAANMFAAKEVGGDFYDFFMIGDTHVATLIADVAGKGLTAALYMMGSKVYLKETIQHSKHGPAAAVQKVNRELCLNNRARMFLTIFVAVLDLETGIVTCVNAGHNPPVMKHADGSVDYLKIKHSLPIGISPDVEYTNVEVQLSRGDRLVLYTDGVTEAKNQDRKLYGEKRFREFLSGIEGSPKDVIDTIKEELDTFSIGVPQSDDITMLVMDYMG